MSERPFMKQKEMSFLDSFTYSEIHASRIIYYYLQFNQSSLPENFGRNFFPTVHAIHRIMEKFKVNLFYTAKSTQ